MDADRLSRTLSRMAHEILERHPDLRRHRARRRAHARRAPRPPPGRAHEAGAPGSSRRWARSTSRSTATTSSTVGPQPVVKGTDIPRSDRRLRGGALDDVLFTGRTVRAALDELVDFGRPRAHRARRARGPRPPRAAHPGRLRGQEGARPRRARSSRSGSSKTTDDDRAGAHPRARRPGPDAAASGSRATLRWRPQGPAGHREPLAGRDRADPRHRGGARRDRRAPDQEGAHAARQDGDQPLLRGLHPHPLQLRDRREAAVGRQPQLLDLGLARWRRARRWSTRRSTCRPWRRTWWSSATPHPGVPHMLAKPSRPGSSTPATAPTSTPPRRCSTPSPCARRREARGAAGWPSSATSSTAAWCARTSGC